MAMTVPISAAVFMTMLGAAGERRYLMVMFCDLVDSTGVAAQVDAEEWHAPARPAEPAA
jgi:hypothetical protein